MCFDMNIRMVARWMDVKLNHRLNSVFIYGFFSLAGFTLNGGFAP